MGANGFDLGGSLASSILNFAANERNNFIQTKLQREAQDWNAQMAAQANQWSIEQWNRENAYNDPSAQMERLSKAGINPALAYASGVFNQAATSPGVSLPEGAKAARTQAWQTDPMMFASLQNAEAQRDLMQSEAELNRSKIPLAEQEINESKQRCLAIVQDINESMARVKNLGEQDREIAQRIARSNFDMIMEDKRYQLEASRVAAEIDRLGADAEFARASAAEKRRLVYEMVQTYALRVYGMELGNKLSEKSIQEAEKRLELLGIDISNASIGLSRNADIKEAVDQSAFWRSGADFFGMLRFIFSGKV